MLSKVCWRLVSSPKQVTPFSSIGPSRNVLLVRLNISSRFPVFILFTGAQLLPVFLAPIHPAQATASPQCDDREQGDHKDAHAHSELGTAFFDRK